MDMEMKRVVEIAWHMRRAIEAVPKNELPLPMSNFPVGACCDASLLLGTYLIECREWGFLYVRGERGLQADKSWTSHGWLTRDDLIIDITADQFADAPAAVIVERNSLWHRNFEWANPEPSDFRVWSGIGTEHLHTMYARLKPALPLLTN